MREERRKWPRVPTEHLVSYTHFDGQGEPDEMGMARTLDLSEGGIVLEMTHALETGSRLEMEMVTGDHVLRARGRVVYNQQLSSGYWRVGVSFTEIKDSDLAIIAQEVHDRRTDEG
jgi:c-di-GMP-binding flagellar brake protein YcgR